MEEYKVACDFKDAKVGDKLYSLLYGWVTVKKLLDRCIVCTIDSAGNTRDWKYDGRYMLVGDTQDLYWGKPEIIAPPKPRRKVTKIIERWVNVYKSGITIHDNKETADDSAGRDRIACCKLTGSYEVEE